MALSPQDPSSFSRPDQAVISHLHLNLDVDFERKVLKGYVTVTVQKKETGISSVIFDTRDLTIQKVILLPSGTEVDFQLDEPTLSFGSKLTVQLPDSSHPKYEVQIHYETSPSATALQWMSPEQTAGKKHPYLFSQCQAIHARSLVPCQDTPGVKMPYTAQISVPSELTALMSAVKSGTVPHDSLPTHAVHTFKQTVPIPSYLIAIVVGALESRKIGPRSHVWSEKEMIEASAYEFAETEQMLSTAEGLMGEYVWGVYDLLVLPPSFPYGGMENPCLTFVTPTLLAGDRSLAFVVAHEITHSWTGNLVTNSNPDHFWLNEGHTMFGERKIAGRMFGEKFRQFEAIGGWKDLKEQIEVVFGVDHPYTVLVPSLIGVDPDDAFSVVPYEKGHSLLMYLEQLLGGPEIFEPFLKAYVDEFKYKSITTNDWKTFLYSFFSDKKATLDSVDWETWLYKPGMPPVKPKFDNSLAEVCLVLATRWSECSDESLSEFSPDDIADLKSYQIKEFLADLLEMPALSHAKLLKMDELYKLSEQKNSEIKFRWLRLCLRARMEDVIDAALDFVTIQGRLKFVRPIYRDLFGWTVSHQKAADHFEKTRQFMHPLTASMVSKDLAASKPT